MRVTPIEHILQKSAVRQMTAHAPAPVPVGVPVPVTTSPSLSACPQILLHQETCPVCSNLKTKERLLTIIIGLVLGAIICKLFLYQ